MTCVVCNQGETRPGATTVTCSRDRCTLVVHDVPAEVCDNCGEAYVDEATTEKLLEMMKTLRQPGTSVVVRDYAPAAVGAE